MSLIRSNIGTVYGTTTKTNSKSQKNLVKYNGSVFEQLEFDLNEIEDNLAEINLGMTIAGYCPCHVEAVVEGGLAFRAGLRPGDLIMRINEVSCCRARLKSVLVLIKRSHTVKIGVYRPLKQQQHRQEPIKAQAVKKSGRQSSLKSKLLSKLLLKPSMWLSCAQPNNQTLHHQSTFYFPASSSTSPIYASLIETAAGNVQSCNVERSHDEIVVGKASSTAVAASSSSSHATAASSDTGYESINNRFDGIMDFIPAASTLFQMPIEDDSQNDEDDEDFEVTMTVNSYSGLAADVTTNSTHHEINHQKQINPTSSTSTLAKSEKFNEMRTRLIGELIEMEANFVSYLTMSVATFSRPLRGFFIKQSDYFCLFQNIEKLLVISENFLRSMDKWSAYDLYTKIGQLYSHKMSLFKEAYTLYARGHHAAKSLLSELREHSKQFRLFLSEVESAELTLQRALDLPIVHVKRTLEIFKQIRAFTLESRRNPAEAPHIDSVIFELRAVLVNLQTSSNIEAVNKKAIFDDDDTMTTSIEFTLSSIEEECDQDDEDTTVDDLTIVRRRRQRRGRRSSSPHINSCCSSSSSSSSSSLSRDGDNEDKNTFFLSPINRF